MRTRIYEVERIGMKEHDTTARAKRAYHSPTRQRRAEEHRRSILVAARGLFTQRGYAGTTLEAIADAAGVSPKTVVARFGSKRGILAEALDPAGLDSRHAGPHRDYRNTWVRSQLYSLDPYADGPQDSLCDQSSD
jgi:AcrR family transcriptional regulator